MMHPYLQARRREEIAAICDNLDGLRATERRVLDEAGYVRAQYDACTDRINAAWGRVMEASRHGGVQDFSGRHGAPSYGGIPDQPGRHQAQLDFDRALADRREAEADQAPWSSRAAQLEQLLTRLRRAINAEEPHAAGVLEELAAMDRPPEPEPAPALLTPTQSRLAAIGQRMSGWAP